MKQPVRYMYVRNAAPDIALAIRRQKPFKLFSFFLISCGATLLFYVVAPIASWQLFYAPGLSTGGLLSPIPKTALIKNIVLGETTERLPFGNLTYASNWFPTGNPKIGIGKEYSLAIPKLGIKGANVIVGSDDLSKSLIHYGGSSLPGEYGNAVVFGHSILPQFFDPKNYKAIFSTLHTLKVGDIIEVIADGVTYNYKVFDMKVIDPTDISVLEQTYDNSYLTVITCTPPGTYWKRLVVKAQIEKI